MRGMMKDLIAAQEKLTAAQKAHEKWLVLLTKLVSRHDAALGNDEE